MTTKALHDANDSTLAIETIGLTQAIRRAARCRRVNLTCRAESSTGCLVTTALAKRP